MVHAFLNILIIHLDRCRMYILYMQQYVLFCTCPELWCPELSAITFPSGNSIHPPMGCLFPTVQL